MVNGSETGGAERAAKGDAGGTRPPALIDGRFEVLGRLGQGVFGPIYRVRDHKLSVGPGRDAALEILRDVNLESPELEALLEAHVDDFGRLEHPAIVRPYASGRTDLGLPYLATAHAGGVTVAEMLASGKLLSVEKVFAIGREVLAALAEAHRNGIKHGALDGRRVVVDLKGGATTPNTYLLDLGRASLFLAADQHPRHDDDLFAVATLLVQMLTGEVVDLAVSTPSAWRARAAGLHIPDARKRPLVRALADRTAARFGDAAAFRAALEDDQPARLPERWTLAAAITCAAAAGAFLGRVTAPSPTVALAAPAQDAARRETDELQAEVQRIADELAGALAARDTATAAREAATAERDDWHRRTDELERTRAQLMTERDKLATKNQYLRADADTAQLALADLERAAVVVASFDTDPFAKRIDDGDGRGADELVAASNLPSDVQAYLGSIAAAATAFASSQAAARSNEEVVRVKRLVHTRERLAAIGPRNGRTALSATGVDVDRIEAALASLHARFDTDVSEVAPEMERRWEAIRTESPDRTPTPVIVAGHWFADGRLDGFVQRYVALLRERGEAAGRLDLTGLRTVASLEEWADAVTADYRLRAQDAGDEILRFRFAQRFFERSDEVLPAVEADFPAPGSPDSGWVADLAARVRLLARGASFPGPRRGRLVFRAVTPEGQVSWQIEDYRPDADPPPDVSRSWQVTRFYFDAAGKSGARREFRLLQVGKRFFEDGVRRALIIDLADPDVDTEIVAYTPRFNGTLPARLPIHPDSLRAFRARVARESPSALAWRDNDSRALYTAGLGLVLRESPGRLVRELVFAEGE